MNLSLAVTLLAAAVGTSARPAPGDRAPDFALPATTGGTIHLSDYAGKSTVVLAFFPKAFTAG